MLPPAPDLAANVLAPRQAIRRRIAGALLRHASVYPAHAMKFPGRSEALFSFKSFAASMLALYVALRVGLPRPFWAMMTTYIVANPMSGAVRSKGIYRVVGTIMGSMAALLLVPGLANAPELLTLALGLWVGICLYVSLLDRMPRSYIFMLGGYTAALIGFPSVGDPSAIFSVALARVEEVSLGIVCATLVHSLVFPQNIGPTILSRIDGAIADVEHWLTDTLSGKSQGVIERDRRKLAADITELRIMSTHLPFDTSHLRWTANTIHVIQDDLSAMVPLLAAMDDRLRALHDIDDADLPADWQKLFGDVLVWRHAGSDAPASQRLFADRIAGLMPAIHPGSSWRDLLMLNMGARLNELIAAYRNCWMHRRHIDDGPNDGIPLVKEGAPAALPVSLHVDHRMALMSAGAAIITIVACCAFWIGTAWSSGASAALMASIFCCFFATQDNPVPALKAFFLYSLLALPIAGIYLLLLIPAVHHFETLVLIMMPFFLVIGMYIAQPKTMVQAMALLLGVAGMLAMQDTGPADIVSLVNNGMAQVAGIGLAAICTSLFRAVNAEWVARRILRAGWTELARLASAGRAPPAAVISARMLDRIALLTPRLAQAGSVLRLSAVEALNDLRVGANIMQLLEARQGLQRQGTDIQYMLDALALHFERRQAKVDMAMPTPMLLDLLDKSLARVCAASQSSEQHVAIVALVGLRRDLFPKAPPYQGA